LSVVTPKQFPIYQITLFQQQKIHFNYINNIFILSFNQSFIQHIFSKLLYFIEGKTKYAKINRLLIYRLTTISDNAKQYPQKDYQNQLKLLIIISMLQDFI